MTCWLVSPRYIAESPAIAARMFFLEDGGLPAANAHCTSFVLPCNQAMLRKESRRVGTRGFGGVIWPQTDIKPFTSQPPGHVTACQTDAAWTVTAGGWRMFVIDRFWPTIKFADRRVKCYVDSMATSRAATARGNACE